MATNYSVDIDHSRLRFKPDHNSLVKLMGDDMPAFAAYNSHEGAPKRKLFAWIVCMYDMHSPLRREIRDLYKRKVYAATLCGFFPRKKGERYDEWIEKFLVGQDEEINELIVTYITSFHSAEYDQLIAHMSIQHSAFDRIIAGETSKENQTVFDISTNKIKDMTRLLYDSGDIDEVLLARKALYKQAAYDLSDMRPENLARKMADGEGLPEGFNPHEEDYLPDDISFVGDDPKIAADDEE